MKCGLQDSKVTGCLGLSQTHLLLCHYEEHGDEAIFFLNDMNVDLIG
jgi:hypothetical protein